MAVSLGELIDELLYAGRGLGDGPLLFTLPSFTFLLSALSNNALRSGAIDGVLRLAPLGLPLWPGLN